jgi:branched-chain amino acid transport system substrate-binding protein
LHGALKAVVRRTAVSAELPLRASVGLVSRRRSIAGLLATAGTLLGGCSGATIGAGEVKAGLILPLSAGGNAGLAGQAMRNAAEMALSEFNSPNIQLLVMDDAGNADTARQVAQQALDGGAEIILGPLFAQSVSAVGQVAHARNVSRRTASIS